MANPIQVTFTVSDPLDVAGLAHACALKNRDLLAEAARNENGDPVGFVPLTSEDYIFYIAGSAIADYREQKILFDKMVAAGLAEPL